VKFSLSDKMLVKIEPRLFNKNGRGKSLLIIVSADCEDYSKMAEALLTQQKQLIDMMTQQIEQLEVQIRNIQVNNPPHQ
jgi:hypothetical protein